MERQIKVKTDKLGKKVITYSYEMDEAGLLERKTMIEKAINAYDYQIKGMTEAREKLQLELDSINETLGK